MFLPGNKVLPFVDLASLIFLVPMAVPYLKKKLIRFFIRYSDYIICRKFNCPFLYKNS
nr:hypothetical protein [Aneurinibacillus sp. XH2]